MRIKKMKVKDECYQNPHQVLITLIPRVHCSAADIDAHLKYYKHGIGVKLISYGQVMNQRAICILLNVDNEGDFETIVSNDPGLTAGTFEIDAVVPYFPIPQQ